MADPDLAMASPVFRPALADFVPEPTGRAASAEVGVRVAEYANLGCLVLRGRADDAAFMGGARDVLALDLPTRPSTLAASDRCTALWISPDEWWVLVPRAARDRVVSELTGSLAGVDSQLVDNSGSLTCLRLAGPQHVMVLRHLCVYDVESIAIGRCVSTVVPKAGWTIVRTDDEGVTLVFRRSFADWIWRLVERSAAPYGISVLTPEQLLAPHFSNLLASRV